MLKTMMPATTNQHSIALAHYQREYERLEKKLNATIQQPFATQRKNAFQQFSKQGFPTQKHPDWKYTPLIPFLQQSFSITSPDSKKTLSLTLPPASSGYRLTFVNGYFVQALSQLKPLPKGVTITPTSLHEHSGYLHAEDPSNQTKNSFIHLNTAFAKDGAYLYLPANTTLESPIELLFITTREQNFTPLRNIIIAEENSHAVIVEKYISLEESAKCYFTNTATDCFLAAKSHLEHYKLIEESEQATHIGHLCVKQQENSQFSAYSIALGGSLVRSEVSVTLCEPEARCELKGLYSAQKKQHSEHQTIIDHLSTDTHSEEIYKGIIDDQARGVFNGKLLVREKAIKSTAKQLNKNLLLSAAAEVFTKPQLEIFVDDIQCTHGASIGQLDETALFYLRARGLSKLAARETLIKAFIHDIIQQMPLVEKNDSLFHSLKNLFAFNYENV